MGPATLTFAAAGTAVAGAAGREQRAHWTIHADGRLRYTAGGPEQVADLWIAGDTPTISNGEARRSFPRVARA